MSVSADCPLQVIGAGPAGMSLMLALCNRVAAANGRDIAEARLLDSLHIIEASDAAGGKMASYRVNANTSAHDVVRGIDDGTPFVAVRDQYLKHPQTQSELIPLVDIGRLMVQPLAQSMRAFLGTRLHCGVEATRIEIMPNGFRSYQPDGKTILDSEALLLCCGARENPLPELLNSVDHWVDRWEGSGQFLVRENLDGLNVDSRPIVIIGASHSAFSCAWRLLYDPLFSEFAGDRDIVLLQRRERIKLRCSQEFAVANGVEFDPEADVCPISGLVFRNGGLRKDAKQLYLDIRDGRETRARILLMERLANQQDLLEEASLILQATGFTSGLPAIERNGLRLEVGKPTVNGELLDLADDRIIPGLFGMGLGLNILPADVPGEPSFNGGLHGFQSYPIAIAPRIIDCLTAQMAVGEIQ
jgi:hypothetical protein